MLDAFGYDQIFSEHSKCIRFVAEESIVGRLEPLLAFRGIQPTIFSGIYPNQHGIWMDYYFDLEHSSFKWTKNTILPSLEPLRNNLKNSFLKKIITFPICLGSKMIYDYSQFPRSTLIPWNFLHFFSFSMCEKISQPNILQPYPTLFDYFKKYNITYEVIDFPMIHSDADMLKKFRQAAKYSFNKDFYFFRFFDLDDVLHKHGLKSSQEANELIKINKKLELILNSIKKKVDDFYLMIFSDTGMTNINKIIDSNSLIKEMRKRFGNNFQFFIDSVMIRFKLKENLNMDSIVKFLNTQKYGLVLTQELKKQFHVNMQDSKYGDIIFVLKNGHIFLPNFYQGSKKIKGMHGYMDNESNLDPLLLLYNQSLMPKKIQNKLKFIDILPSILDIYKIRPKMEYQGRSLLKFSE